VSRFWCAVAAVAVLLSGALAHAGDEQLMQSTLTPAQNASREILLTFRDRGLERTPNASPGRYIRRAINYQSTAWSRSVTRDIARDYHLNAVVEWPIRALGVHCVVYTVGEAQSVEEIIQQLVRDDRVEAVQPMNTFHALAAEDPYKRLQTAFGSTQLDTVHQWTTGRDVSVAIIDSGVDTGHPDLAGQVAERLDLTNSASEFNDDIHGTAVAGIIGAIADNGEGIAGLAPDAQLFALRACWTERPGDIGAICNSLTVARALDVAITLKPQILNLSLTGPSDPLVDALLQVGLDNGLIIVAAEPPGEEPSGFLAGLKEIILVSAGGADVTVPRQPVLTVVRAPGRDILTTFPRGTYNFASGSSFAAANVSGVIALLLELQPDLSSREIRTLLLDGMSEPDVSDTGDGLGNLDLCRTVAQLRDDIFCTGASVSQALATDRSAANLEF